MPDLNHTPFAPFVPAKHAKNLTGQRFTLLTVISIHSKDARHNICWICRCDCGYWCVKPAFALVGGRARSCGKHPLNNLLAMYAPTGDKYKAERRAFAGAQSRCWQPSHQAYVWYGGRGIEFRFNSFDEFFADIGKRPSNQHSLDRIDVNGHYEQGNVRWATSMEQANNKRTNVIWEYQGRSQTIAEWCRELGQNRKMAARRVRKYHWCIECALTLPAYRHCPHIPPVLTHVTK